MYLFALIILAASSAFTEETTVKHLRLRRTAQLESKHQDYDHTDSSSFSISFDENVGGVTKQNADGSVYNQTYDHKKKEMDRQQTAAQVGNVIETGPNATGKTVHYNKGNTDKESSKSSSNTGHKDVIKKPVFVKGPDGKMVLSKANETLHQVYNHTAGAASRQKQSKDLGKHIEKVGGAVKRQEIYDNSLQDASNKEFKKNIGEQTVKDQAGNYSNSSYNQSSGKQSGSHKASQKGSKDLATKLNKTTD